MDEKFQNKYRIESTRLPGFDYSSLGYYFVTICTKNKEHFFGEVVNGAMQLSAMGSIVMQEWYETELIRPNVFIDAWMVMPNHFHAIVGIKNKNESSQNVETHCNASLPVGAPTGGSSPSYQNAFGSQSQNLSAIIRGFKGAVTNQIHTQGFADFAWQPAFYDCIIWDDRALNLVRAYIQNNSAKWYRDRNNGREPDVAAWPYNNTAPYLDDY